MKEESESNLIQQQFGSEYSLENIDSKRAKDTPFQDLHQTITASENTFKVALINELIRNGISCNVCHNEYLVIKRSTVKKRLKDLEQLELLNDLTHSEFIIRRPDFLLIKYGIVIEVDGPVHHNSAHKNTSDVLRDYIYDSLKLKAFRIPNDQVHSNKGRSLLISDVIKYIKTVDQSGNREKAYSSLKKQLSLARKAYSKAPIAQTNGELAIGTYCRSNPKRAFYPALPNVPTYVQNGGYRIVLKSKLK